MVTATGFIGRDREASIVLSDGRVSSRHGYLHVEEGRVTYSDLETSNGSFLSLGSGRRRLRGPHVISDGDEIIVGYTVLRYMQHTRGGSR
jgi:pSer/pThr/pTyr-binding forkhead associated (FHA) protein